MIFLPPLGGSKELVVPYLQDLADAGFVALSFDPWQHGERSTESQMEIWTRVFGNFRRHMWPILGQTTLDLLRIIDWAVVTLDVGTILPPGEPDAYARYFYDHLNPLTHLVAFAHGPAIHFVCGEHDTHVPPDGAFRFQTALREAYPVAGDHVQVTLVPGLGHMDFAKSKPWWSDCLGWLTHS
jgi:hypothetical protein